MTTTDKKVPVLLAFGDVLITPGCEAAFLAAEENPGGYLARHVHGDWGELSEDDAALNDRAVQEGRRILSAYLLGDGTKVWVCTEGDRSATTLLLPSEY